MKKIFALILTLATLVSSLSLTACDFLSIFGGKTYVKRENGDRVEVQSLVQTAEKNENFLDTQVTWYDDTFNYYVYYIGKIKNVPLTTTYSVFTYDGANLSYERSITKATQKSIETTTQQAITTTVQTETTDTVEIKGSVGASYMQTVSAKVEAGYSSATTNSTTTEDVWSQSYSECVTESESETSTITITFDSSCSHGNYMYLYLGNVKVYYVVMQLRKNPNEYYIETFNSIESHRYALIYTGENDEYPIDTESKIKIDPSFIADLEPPAKYIEGLKPEEMLLPVTGQEFLASSTDIKGYYSHNWTYQIPNLAEYYAEGYNKIEISYEFYSAAERHLLSGDSMSIEVYLSPDTKSDNSFYSQKTEAKNEGNWVRGTTTTDLKWLIENEKFCLIIFNAHKPLLFDRKVTVNKFTLSYKVYRDNNAG